MRQPPAGIARRRISFDADDTTMSIVEWAREHGKTPRDVCTESLQAARYPGLRFHASRTRVPLVPFLQGTDPLLKGNGAFQIVLIGVTLSSFWLRQEGRGPQLETAEDVVQCLKDLVSERVPLWFMMLDPTVPEEEYTDESAPAFALWDRRHREGYRQGLKQALEYTVEHLKGLHRHAVEHGSDLKVFGLRRSPECGLAIVNPNTDHCRVRAKLYLETYPKEMLTLLDAQATTADGRQACQAFVRHYEHLLGTSARPLNVSEL